MDDLLYETTKDILKLCHEDWVVLGQRQREREQDIGVWTQTYACMGAWSITKEERIAFEINGLGDC